MFLLHLFPAGQESWLIMWESTRLPCHSTAKVLWFEAPLLPALLPTHRLSLAGPSYWTLQEQSTFTGILYSCSDAVVRTSSPALACLCPPIERGQSIAATETCPWSGQSPGHGLEICSYVGMSCFCVKRMSSFLGVYKCQIKQMQPCLCSMKSMFTFCSSQSLYFYSLLRAVSQTVSHGGCF